MKLSLPAASGSWVASAVVDVDFCRQWMVAQGAPSAVYRDHHGNPPVGCARERWQTTWSNGGRLERAKIPEEWWELSRASLESMGWNGVSGEVGPVEDEGPSHCQWKEMGIIGSRKGHSSTRAPWHSMGREPMTHGSF